MNTLQEALVNARVISLGYKRGQRIYGNPSSQTEQTNFETEQLTIVLQKSISKLDESTSENRSLNGRIVREILKYIDLLEQAIQNHKNNFINKSYDKNAEDVFVHSVIMGDLDRVLFLTSYSYPNFKIIGHCAINWQPVENTIKYARQKMKDVADCNFSQIKQKIEDIKLFLLVSIKASALVKN